MNKAMVEQHLSEARRHVAEGEIHIARQRKIVYELQRDGKDTAMALRLLDNFIDLQTMHIADMERLKRELSIAS